MSKVRKKENFRETEGRRKLVIGICASFIALAACSSAEGEGGVAKEEESWKVEGPLPGSPLIVFVNSKSGDGHGERFLRRFKQILNPAQVFDLSAGGPNLG